MSIERTQVVIIGGVPAIYSRDRIGSRGATA
jgi:hypothetical protein